MPTVETTITVSIPEGGATLREVEAEVAKGVQSEMPRTAEAGRKLLLAACQALEAEAMATLVGRVQRVKMRPLDMLTRFGWVRLGRQQVVERRLGHYTYPLDKVLKLEPRQNASPWVVAQAVALATRIPYRQATRLLVEVLEAAVDHRTVYAWVRRPGPRWWKRRTKSRRRSLRCAQDRLWPW